MGRAMFEAGGGEQLTNYFMQNDNRVTINGDGFVQQTIERYCEYSMLELDSPY
jgi:hypothetical protein